ncbi:ras-related protein Rab-32-like isoform X2 [Dysidea avara]
MHRLINRFAELVPGRVMQPNCPLPYTSGNSTFYAPSPRGVVKADNELPYAVQVTDSLTSSTDSYASLLSSQELLRLSKADIPQKRLDIPVTKEPSYHSIDSQEIKILVVGEKCTGKTQMMQHAVEKSFDCRYNVSSTVNCRCKIVRYKERLYTLNFWDLSDAVLAKEEHYREFYGGAMAAFVVFSLLDEKSLSAAVELKKRINNSVCLTSGDPIPVYLLGNKCDMEGCRYDGSTTARRHGFRDYFITSAKTGEGISYAVEQVVREVLKESYPNLPKVCETPDHLKAK